MVGIGKRKMNKLFPFYPNTYYMNKFSGSYKRYLFNYRWKKYNPVMRPGPPWVKDFVIYPNYATLIRKTNLRMRKKK